VGRTIRKASTTSEPVSRQPPRRGQPLIAALDRDLVGCYRASKTCRARHESIWWRRPLADDSILRQATAVLHGCFSHQDRDLPAAGLLSGTAASGLGAERGIAQHRDC
ncbi:MAG: hypothetical protein ACXVAI_06325, partial [Candidatus Limnocylindrales bacterium]